MNLSKEKETILSDKKHNIKVVAGPGSGKTTLLIEKVSRLIEEGTDSRRILLITYTNKSADDLLNKMNERFGNEKKFYISTIHRFCSIFRIENPNYFSNYRKFKVLEDYKQYLFIVKHSKKIRSGENNKNISELKNYFGRIKDNYFIEELQNKNFDLKNSYFEYCKLLSNNNNFDYGDLIHVVINNIKNNSKLEDIARDKFDYVFVDEYQDINRIQENLIKLFLGENTKLWVVGDRNQSIYGFRGSDITIFDRFLTTFPNSKEYYMKKNYRSTQKIIDFSNRFLRLSEEEKVFGNDKLEDGPITPKGIKIKINKYSSTSEETLSIVNYIKQLKKDGVIEDYSNIAVLFSSVKSLSSEIILAFEKENIKYEVIGDGGLFKERYIKEILEVFKKWPEYKKIENTFLELKLNEDIVKYSINPLTSLYEIIGNSKYLKNKVEESDEKVLFNIAKLSELIKANMDSFDSDSERIYTSLIKIKKDYLDTEQPVENIKDSVKIMTFHKAKGLEYPIIIIPNIEKNFKQKSKRDELKGLFPNYSPSDDFERAKYVAITRAKDQLFFSYSKSNNWTSEILTNKDLVYSETKEASNILSFIGDESQLEIRPNSKKENNIELTHYKLEEFLKCPFSYKLRHYNGFAIPSAHSLSYGSILHALLLQINTKISQKENIDIDKFLNDQSGKYSDNNLFRYKKPIENYLRDFKKELNSLDILPEVQFERNIFGCLFRGRADLVLVNKNGKKIICEFKSGKYSKEAEQKVRRQLELYALAFNYKNIDKGIIYFCGDNGKKIDIKLDSQQTSFGINNIIDEIKNYNFKPNSNNCNQGRECIFSPFCPYYNKNAIKTDDDEYEDDKYILI